MKMIKDFKHHLYEKTTTKLSKINEKLSHRHPKTMAFLLFIGSYMATQAPVVVSAAADTSKIPTSLGNAEDPTMNMFKVVGKFAALVCIAMGGAAQFFGREFSSRGKMLWFGAIAGCAVIWNAPALRDFVISLF